VAIKLTRRRAGRVPKLRILYDSIYRQPATLILILSASIPTLLFAYLGQFSRLMSDDYLFMGLFQEFGIWDSLLYWRLHWSGEYTTHLFWGLLTQLGESAASAFPLVVIAGTVVGYAWLANAVLAYAGISANRRAIVVALASFSATATINGFISGQSFYFLSGAVDYTWPAVMLLILSAIGVETARRLHERIHHLLAAAAAAIFMFINAGFSEMFMVFQLSLISLVIGFVYAFYFGLYRKAYLSLAAAAFLGTCVSLLVQFTAPGVAIRAAESTFLGNPMQPIRELPNLLGATLNVVAKHLGRQAGFAGFILVASAGLFAALTPGSPRADAKTRRIRGARAPFVFALVVQILCLPYLWSHQSDNLQVLGRFSYAFALVVGINFLAIASLAALLWRRRLLEQWLNRPAGMMVYCSCMLIAICVLFAMTQVRSVHYKAVSYCFLTALAGLVVLGHQLSAAAGEPRFKTLLQVAIFCSAGTVIVFAAQIAVELWGTGHIIERTFSAVAFLLTVSGLMWGVTLGAMMQRGYSLSRANATWLQRVKILCLLITIIISAGIVIGRGQRISHLREDAALWDAIHLEILRLRDEGDPAVYSNRYPRRFMYALDATPLVYKTTHLSWKKLLYYRLEYEFPPYPPQ